MGTVLFRAYGETLPRPALPLKKACRLDRGIAVVAMLHGIEKALSHERCPAQTLARPTEDDQRLAFIEHEYSFMFSNAPNRCAVPAGTA
jgi:hypothetical protein